MFSKMISFLLIVSYILEGNGIDIIVDDSPADIYRPLKFSWSSCGSKSDSIHVQNLAVLPDPLIIPGNVYLGTNFTVDAPELSPLPLSIHVKKKVVFVWVTIPCEKGIGSCSYDDACQLVTKFKCPQAFTKYGIPCQCPLPKNIYSLPTSLVANIDKSILPSWLESGAYKVRAQLSDKNSNEVSCIDMSFTIGAKLAPINYIDNYI